MKTEISERYQVLFIVFVSLGVYYPSIFGHANSVDDVSMMTNLFNARHVDVTDLFFPGSPRAYYRPVLLLSFFFDRFVFFCSESFMHLNNIILHTANGVLVFLIVREIIRIFKISVNGYIPMFTSLIFILHPINTESVNWLSARTDLLAGVFVFAAFLFFLKKGMESFPWGLASAFFYLMGLLSKEVAIGFLPVVVLFLTLKEKPIREIPPFRRLLLFLPFLFATLLYFLMRAAASGYFHVGFVTVAGATWNDHLQIVWGNAVKAFGFYVKKLFVPVPLNFCIMKISGKFYFWFGILAAAVTGFVLWRRRSLLSFFLLFAIVFFLPAIPIAMRIIEAWTPMGERYLYISSMGASFLVAIMSEKMSWRREIKICLMVLLLGTAAFTTINRNIVWQNNLTLFEDTVKKSPDSAAVRNEYAIALLNKGRTDEALEQFRISANLAGKIKHRELPSLNTIEVRISRGDDPKEIREDYMKLFETVPEAATEIRLRFVGFLDSQAMEEKDPNKRKELYKEIIVHTENLFEVTKNGFYQYRTGQLYLALGDREKAIDHFKKALELSPNEYFSDTARKLLVKLDAKS